MLPVPRAAAEHGLSYRALTEDDLPFVESLYLSTRADEIAATGWPADIQREFLRNQFRLQHDHYQQSYSDLEWLVIERDREPIGRLYLNESAERLHVVDIALLPSEQRRGIGTAILTDLLQDARASSKQVSIFVEMNNPALGLYRRLGFEAQEEHGLYIFMVTTAGSLS